ncbi:hypothetical protein MBLNU459_g5501t1 [Dothideomycetes sp. NU459]
MANRYVVPSLATPVEMDPSAPGTIVRRAMVIEALFNIGTLPLLLYPKEMLSYVVTRPSEITDTAATMAQLFSTLVVGALTPLLLLGVPNTRSAIESRRTIYYTLGAGEAFLIPYFLYQATVGHSGLTPLACLGSVASCDKRAQSTYADTMADGERPGMLALPVVTALKEEAAGDGAHRAHMERTVSQDIREEREDLKRAAEESLHFNAIVDIAFDTTIRWVSPSWKDLTGAEPESIVGVAMADIVYDNKAIFLDSIQSMRSEDSKSRIIRFAVKRAAPTPVEQPSDGDDLSKTEQADDGLINLEAQGIMVYDRSSGEESHTMWLIKPAIRREITINLPNVLVEGLGIGAHVLAQYLTTLADVGADDPFEHLAPPPVLCRICERQISAWWFEKHTELCALEHKAESEVQMAQETLTEHRSSIVKVLDALEAQARHARSTSSDASSPSPVPQAEYKGNSIGPSSQPSSGPSSGRASPAASQLRSRDSSRSSLGHQRARSFAVRRPLARIVELVLDLCDTALEISPPAVKDVSGQANAEIRTQSPQSESRISQILQWQSPSGSTLESEQGLSLLCDDTSTLSKAKVEAVFRLRRILEYSERLRIEFHVLVQECIDEALAKAARIVAGELSDSSEESSSSSTDRQDDDQMSDVEATPRVTESADDVAVGSYGSVVGPSSIALALRNASALSSSNPSWRRTSSPGGSSRSDSPRGTKTPRSYGSALSSLIHQKRGGTMAPDSDAGGESDSSIRSSLASAPTRADSPGPELSLSRVASSRDRKRRSLVLPSLSGNSRQQSPTRSTIVPSSPLRMAKPRLTSGADSVPSPLTSPILSTSDFSSPIIRAQQQQHHHHHRRQSSAAFSEGIRPPSSPRLSAVNSQPQPRAVQTSIKDFEIIKPISKGAFGSVYLAKKKVTGDYYAIKVLKKADMVAKNQVTNVKAERAIMMWQGESDFVAKLYWTFSSKDYLYLVMEYLNGGDCASLIKSLGGLPEDWAKKYLAEVVLGVQHLHDRQIVHRDLKPDNLLIDQKGHLKLTDFGLSRMGLLGRQKRLQNAKTSEAPDLLKLGSLRRAPSIASSRSTSFDFLNGQSPAGTPAMTPALTGEIGQPSYFNLTRESSREPSRRTSGQRSDSGDSESLHAMFRRFSLADDPLYNRRTPIEEETGSEGDSPEPFNLQPIVSNGGAPLLNTPPSYSGMLPPPMALFEPEDSMRRFVGTPDYLAPETVNGVGQDEISDWWSLGCILFECLYGYPPFHANTPEEVFQNILARKIDWPDDDDCPVSVEAKDLMNRLMSLDPKQRMGANIEEKFPNGGDEIRAHPWFADVEWSTLRDDEASFIPAPATPEDTEYFDTRGATLQNFQAEFEDQVSSPAGTPGADYPDRPHDALSRVRNQVNSMKRGLMPLHIPPHVRDGRSRRLSEPVIADDFGNFQFKNLPVLEKANKDVIQKLRAEAMQAQSKSPANATPPAVLSPAPSLESSPVMPMPLKRTLSANKSLRPASPSLLSQQSHSSPSRGSQPSSPLLVSFSASGHHERRKTSSASSTLSQSISNSLQPGGLLEAPRLPAGFKSLSAASSPIKIPVTGNGHHPGYQDKSSFPHRRGSISSPRQRSHTLESQSDDIVPGIISHHKRRSMAIDNSPSSSDNEDQRTKALLRVQRRRQSSRRLSQITLAEGPIFRPLDVLICEDHPVSRLVMERLLEKLRCRTISVTNGGEAMRYAMSEVKFDIIMMEFKLPQINGADVARMIRDTKNANSHTPMVAVTGYLKDLQAPHYFDALIEKPPTTEKLTEVMSRLCQWKPPPPGWTPVQTMGMGPSSLRKEAVLATDSPTTSSLSGYGLLSNSYRGSSREDSIGSSSFGEIDGRFDSIPVIISRQATSEWHDSDLERNFGTLVIGAEELQESPPKTMNASRLPALTEQTSAPGCLETTVIPEMSPRRQPSMEAIEAKRRSLEKDRHECAESGDDEDEELGDAQIRSRSPKSKLRGSSKLGTEMLRTNSQGSVVSGEDLMGSQALRSTPRSAHPEAAISEELQAELAAEVLSGGLTPPEIFSVPGDNVEEIDMDATPKPQHTAEPDPDPTPRASTSPSRRG